MRLEHIKDMAVGMSEGRFSSLKVEMEYLPVLSKNAYKTREGFIKRACIDWMDELAWAIRVLLNGQNIKLEPPLNILVELEVSGVGRLPDTQNMIDVLADAIENGTGINDKDFIIRTIPARRGDDSKIIITIKEG